MKVAITKKDTLNGSELKLGAVIWAKVGSAGTTKGSQICIIWLSSKELMEMSIKVKNLSKCPINQVGCRKKGMIPELQWHRGMS
jgi:hypothetical protein